MIFVVVFGNAGMMEVSLVQSKTTPVVWFSQGKNLRP